MGKKASDPWRTDTDRWSEAKPEERSFWPTFWEASDERELKIKASRPYPTPEE